MLTEDLLAKSTAKYSVFAHIVADEPGGPRGDVVLSPKLAADIGNIMLLCFDCHRRIDVEDVTGHPVERLLAMKERHEERVRRLTDIDDGNRTLLVLMEANIGDRKGVVRLGDARAAVLPMYPAAEVVIDLARLRLPDGDGVAWAAGVAEIDEAGKRVQEALVRGDAKHISVFALAPIPLLMHLGRVLGDVAPGEAYQRFRDPAGWTWQPDDADAGATFEVRSAVELVDSADVLLVLSVSDEIDVQLVRDAAPAAAGLYVVRVAAPKTDVIRSRRQVAEFRGVIRSLLPQIRAAHGAKPTVHVFPALPNSLAVEFGRVLLPKSDPMIVVYDLNRARGGWTRAVTLLSGLAESGTERVLR